MYKYMKKNILFVFLSVLALLSCDSGPKASPEYIEALNTHREKYKVDFKINERAPLRTDEELDLMDFYEANESYNCTCDFVKENEIKPIVMSTYAGKKKDFIIYGKATCKAEGSEFSLLLYQSALARMNPLSASKLFLPFKDLTSGEETYGGGRYMDVSVDNIKRDKISLDFNHSYNPWCAYSDGYNCPIPPAENHLSIAMQVGEKNYLGEVKH